jgi:hexosaminidase
MRGNRRRARPVLARRASGRGQVFYPKRELLAPIDACAALKLSRFHLHLTDDQGWRIESRRYPAPHEVGSHRPWSRLSLDGEAPVYDESPHGGYYTLTDLAEISAYAAQRMVTLVPEIEIPGSRLGPAGGHARARLRPGGSRRLRSERGLGDLPGPRVAAAADQGLPR